MSKLNKNIFGKIKTLEIKSHIFALYSHLSAQSQGAKHNVF